VTGNGKARVERRSLGAALRVLREQAGITQRELAERAGSDAPYVSRIERGAIDVGWSLLLRLLDALGSDLHQLADAIERAERGS
jgi:transcriptional regulator with XRE-family HTH domain